MNISKVTLKLLNPLEVCVISTQLSVKFTFIYITVWEKFSVKKLFMGGANKQNNEVGIPTKFIYTGSEQWISSMTYLSTTTYCTKCYSTSSYSY